MSKRNAVESWEHKRIKQRWAQDDVDWVVARCMHILPGNNGICLHNVQSKTKEQKTLVTSSSSFYTQESQWSRKFGHKNTRTQKVSPSAYDFYETYVALVVHDNIIRFILNCVY